MHENRVYKFVIFESNRNREESYTIMSPSRTHKENEARGLSGGRHNSRIGEAGRNKRKREKKKGRKKEKEEKIRVEQRSQGGAETASGLTT
jgi:hypothetical protein